jgi:hypothetical protein
VDTVPSDGGWPLGMAATSITSTTATITPATATTADSVDESLLVAEEETIDVYEAEKQARLHARLKGLSVVDDDAVNTNANANTDNAAHANVIESEQPAALDWLETRQWDYKYKMKNPLFGIMHEKERMILLLADSSEEGEKSDTPPTTTFEKKALARARSGSIDKKALARARSGSIDKKASQHVTTRARSGSFAEQYNDVYTQVQVHHVRNELETLRNNRSKEGNIGCTCRKLDVYLLPPGGGGKKAHSRRMNEKKVKEELRKRHLLPQEKKTRDELEILLHDTVEKEPCCMDDCACVRDGIECQADTCQCWFTSHQAEKGKKHDGIPSIQMINTRCGNRFGMYTVDVVKIDNFRSSYICVEIKS